MFGLWEGHIDCNPVVDSDWAESSCGPLKVNRREIGEAAYLILHLDIVSPIRSGLDRAVRARNPVLPGIQPLLNSVPAFSFHFYQILRSFIFLLNCINIHLNLNYNVQLNVSKLN